MRHDDAMQEHGIPLDRALQVLRDHLPPHAILVGQNIGKDVEWLGLKEGVDFHSLMDLVSALNVRSVRIGL